MGGDGAYALYPHHEWMFENMTVMQEIQEAKKKFKKGTIGGDAARDAEKIIQTGNTAYIIIKMHYHEDMEAYLNKAWKEIHAKEEGA